MAEHERVTLLATLLTIPQESFAKAILALGALVLLEHWFGRQVS